MRRAARLLGRTLGQILAACVVLAAGMGAAQAPQAKLALVIGNADYNGDGRVDASAAGIAASEAAGFVPDLRNPLNDATDIRDALAGVGFRVDLVTNADGATMSTALAAFGAKVAAAPDDVQVVVYYAGHAIQVDGANFLIPVGARLPAADFASMPTNQVQTVLRRVAVSTTEIGEQLKQLRAPGANLLIFDACRNNPWEERVRGIGRSATQTRGLAEIAAPPRTIIAFATAPGHTASDGGGRNSPFTGVLKTWIGKPGNVRDMLDGVGGEVQEATGGRQTPWVQSASVGQVCLASCLTPGSAELTASEDVVIGAARALGGDTLFRLYLQAFPNGRYVGEARTALAAAGPAMPVAQRCEQLRVPVNVFFEYDRATLTPDAMAILEHFAGQTGPQLNFLREYCGLSTVVVAGHTDTSVSPAYAVALSQRQAQAVVNALVAQGFPADHIVAEGRGASQPRVATADGVREPLNRRVEILLAR